LVFYDCFLLGSDFWGLVVTNSRNTFSIDTKAAAKAVLLPGILPRIKDLFGSPLVFLAYGYAYLFYMVRLLPENHPYLQKQNFGKFGIFKVLVAASENLEFKLKNVDRVVAYFSVLASLFIIIILSIMALLYVVMGIAWAQVPSLSELFLTPNPQDDIALMMLDATFGIPGIFNSSMMPAAPSPFHAAMQNELFGLYNYMFLVIGVVIMCIHVMHAIFDTIQSGTLFGRKFNSFWGPFRLLLGVGLLLPVAYSFNSAQYIMLYTAKFGSGLATNAWKAMTDEAIIPIGGVEIAANNYRNLITEPPRPNISGLIGFMHLVKTCEYFYENVNDGHAEFDKDIRAYHIYRNSSTEITAPGQYATAIANSEGQSINIVFGHKETNAATGTEQAQRYAGNVIPYCGEITVEVTAALSPGAAAAQEGHFDNVMTLYLQPPIAAFAHQMHYMYMSGVPCPSAAEYAQLGAAAGTCSTGIPKSYTDTYYNVTLPVLGDVPSFMAVAALQASTEFEYTLELERRGWAGAGLWYGRVTDLNGSLMEAVMQVPSATKLPLILTKILEMRTQKETDVAAEDMFSLTSADGTIIKDIGASVSGEEDLVNVLSEVYKLMLGPESAITTSTIDDTSPMSAIESIINMIFGTAGITNMSKNSDTHAMFQLTAIGKGLIETSIRNLLTSTLASASGGFFAQLNTPAAKVMGGVSSAIAGFASMIGGLTLTAGIILYYIVPLMPFMYFFFACGRWVKSVFEALVGAPLWALAHLKYDGEGLGDMAISGYYLIFEILIRPILIVFGLIAALSIFGALVTVLNDTWSIVTTNLTGFDHDANPATWDVDGVRSRIDQLFFSIFYVIVIYVMAQSSFKLIDLIPNQILRWMGSSTSSFGDMAQDPLDTLTRTAAISGSQMVPQATGAASKAASGLGSAGGAAFKGAIGK
jgi:conjugal transfer/type IV secretion protein DotA/TraY